MDVPHDRAKPTAVRFALRSDVPPALADAARWGDLARTAAMARFGRMNGGAPSPTLSGKDADGKPLTGHRHAFYLPTDEDGDGEIDRLTVWTPFGFGADELAAVESLRELNPGRGREPARLTHLASGRAADFAAESPPFGRCARWRSASPYVPTRHAKRRGPKDADGRRQLVDGAKEQITREANRRFPNARLISAEFADVRKPIAPIAPAGDFAGFRPFDFFRYRRKGSNGGGAFNFSVEFDRPVAGPVALGFACHYGLGLFTPDTDTDDDRQDNRQNQVSPESDGGSEEREERA